MGRYLQLGECVVVLVEPGLCTAVQHRVVDLPVHPAHPTDPHMVSWSSRTEAGMPRCWTIEERGEWSYLATTATFMARCAKSSEQWDSPITS